MAVVNKAGSASTSSAGSSSLATDTSSSIPERSVPGSSIPGSSMKSGATLPSAPSLTSNSDPTTAVTVNAAFLEEVKTIHHELWHLLEATKLMCSKHQRTSHWQAQFVKSMEELRDLFAMQFALEEGYGYFDEPAFVESKTSARASALRNDHKSLYQEINGIAEWLADLRHSGSLASQIPNVKIRFDAFCEQLQTHEEQEKELIYEAYYDDIGTGD